MFNVLTNLKKHPKGLYFLFLTEMAERFSFYTMKNLLVLYGVNYLGLSDSASSWIYGIFFGCVWGFPLFGGLIADRKWGVIKTVFWGGVVFFFGHLFLGLTEFLPGGGVEAKTQFWGSPACYVFVLGLLLLACGNGLFKGNISVLVGALYDDEKLKGMRDEAFQIFYFGINIGSFFAGFTAPWLRDRFGWGIAFGSAAFAIMFSFALFLIGRRFYKDRLPRSASSEAAEPRRPLTLKEKTQLKAVFFVLCLSALWWSIYFQDGLALTLFADRHTELPTIDLYFFSWQLTAPNFQAINPFSILLLSPVFVLLWQWFRNRGKEPSVPKKMVFGFLALASAMGVMTFAATLISNSPGQKVSPIFIGLTFFLFSIGELFVSPMGLSFVTKYAPPGWKGLMMGGWFGSLAIGSYATGYLNSLGLPLVQFYGLLLGLMLGATFLLFLYLKKIGKALD